MLHEPCRTVGRQSTLLHAVQHGGVPCMGIVHGAHKGRATPSIDANTYCVRGAEVVGGHKAMSTNRRDCPRAPVFWKFLGCGKIRAW